MKNMKITCKIHKKTMYLSCITHVLLMYLVKFIIFFRNQKTINTYKIHVQYMLFTWDSHYKTRLSMYFSCISKKINVFFDSDKYGKMTCISHVFLMYFLCIFMYFYVFKKFVKKIYKKSMYFSCISYVFLMY